MRLQHDRRRARAILLASTALSAAAVSCATGGEFGGGAATTTSAGGSTGSTTSTTSSVAMGGSGGSGGTGTTSTSTTSSTTTTTTTSSTTTTTTTSSTTTTTTSSGPPPCTTPDDCPAPPNACVKAECKFGFCDTSKVALGTVVSQEPNGDCHRDTCDGMGNVVSNVDNTDAPDDAKACTFDVCTGGVALHPFKSSGTACNEGGGKVCNGSGVCVACVTDTDCGAGKTCVGQQCM